MTWTGYQYQETDADGWTTFWRLDPRGQDFQLSDWTGAPDRPGHRLWIRAATPAGVRGRWLTAAPALTLDVRAELGIYNAIAPVDILINNTLYSRHSLEPGEQQLHIPLPIRTPETPPTPATQAIRQVETSHPTQTTQPVNTTHRANTTPPGNTTHPAATTSPATTTHPPATTPPGNTTHPAATPPVRTAHRAKTTSPVNTTHPAGDTTHSTQTTQPVSTTRRANTTPPGNTTHPAATTSPADTTHPPATSLPGDAPEVSSPHQLAPVEVEIWLPQGGVVSVRGPVFSGAAEGVPIGGRRWVAYGSSISQCTGAYGPSETWPALVARRYGWNLTGMGFAGECHLDPVVARTIRDTPADLISLCLGINVYGGATFSGRTLPSAVESFIATVRAGHPMTPIIVITPLLVPNREGKPNEVGLTLDDVRTCVELGARTDPAVQVIDGRQILSTDEAQALYVDNLHPGPDGYRLIAQRLAPLLNFTNT